MLSDKLSSVLEAKSQAMLDRLGIFPPPVDAIAVARGLGMVVAKDANQQSRGRFVRLPLPGLNKQESILLRPESRPERRQWATAHEIGESIAYQIVAEWGQDPRDLPHGAREQLANLFATRLLLPGSCFFPDVTKTDCDLLELKGLYKTASFELIAKRLLDSDKMAVVTIVDKSKISFRRGPQFRPVPGITNDERVCLKIVHDSGKPYQRSGAAMFVQGWAIHEPDWKREILVSTPHVAQGASM